MEKERKKDAPTTRQLEDLAIYDTPLGSPSYSPPPHEESLEEEKEEDVEGEDDSDEEEDHDTDKEARAARHKAKGKAKVSSSPSPEEEDDDEEEEEDDDDDGDDDDDDDDDSNKENDHPSETSHSAKSNSITSSPAADEDTQMDVDMDTYWAHEARKALEIAAREDALGSGRNTQFGDADAFMNETLYSSSSPSSSNNNNKENQRYKKASPLAPKNSPDRHEAGWPGDGGRGHGRGRGRGRGRGSGWGLAWQETMAEEKMEPEEKDHWDIYDDPPPSPSQEDHWGIYDDPPPSPSEEEQERHVLEETAWEEYDYEAWERAAQEAAENERREARTLKEPDTTTFSATPVRVNEIGEGSSKSSKGEDSMSQSVQFVRAVRDYKAILSGNYLSYQKDDVMKVLHRDSDGSLMHPLDQFCLTLY